eukprot:CAMPEP_0197532510 /NCGR_PEP_ID=MMETSP1318-20131121/39980_1 /TAXON_ID=552666 /ORGANISM="Partenskyella glossopodia, Strain RCC365" /LENGTH=129 /DNA_ID=CAMNT_0043089089 /DNA_START=307 /DNA_END=696 /DNA_ORIENTATION=-
MRRHLATELRQAGNRLKVQPLLICICIPAHTPHHSTLGSELEERRHQRMNGDIVVRMQPPAMFGILALNRSVVPQHEGVVFQLPFAGQNLKAEGHLGLHVLQNHTHDRTHHPQGRRFTGHILDVRPPRH